MCIHITCKRMSDVAYCLGLFNSGEGKVLHPKGGRRIFERVAKKIRRKIEGVTGLLVKDHNK